MKNKEKLVLLSDNIFTATSDCPMEGFVAICGNRIEAVGPKSEADNWITDSTRVIDLGSKVVTPGFADVHTFFSGWVLCSLGIDFADIGTDLQAVEAIEAYLASHGGATAVFGHNWNPGQFSETEPGILDRVFPELPVVIFTADRGTCWMNQAATNRYGFTPEACYAEKIWRMMREYLTLPEMAEKYVEYMQLLNRQGVTTIKEMTFDDYYGFMDVMEQLEREGRMTVRVSMMSQPVGRGIDIPHGLAMRERFQGDFVSFSGYNRMTDRGIPSFLGELIEPYKSRPDITCLVPVEWDLIERETLEADRNGFRYSLHCQGDGAVRHTVDLFSRCQMENGKLKNRHAITDLEYSNPEDLKRFGQIGGITEVYAQIQSLDRKQDVLDMIDRQLGGDRGKNYWNRKKMWEAGITVSCGTDLPLLVPDIPEAITCGCGGFFADGESYNEENMLSVAQMLTAWTKNGQYNCYNEDRLGTLEPGKLADITVLDQNIFEMPLAEAKNAKVCMTVSDGKIVYDAT